MTTRADLWEREYYAKGFAVCQPDIIHDRVYCRFRDEEFFVSGADEMNLILDQGPLSGDETRKGMLHAKVEELRKLKKG